jgi:DNA-directed RNA polymerase specialized sigma24 family protein
MADEAEISLWLGRLTEGDQSAVQHVWEQYCERLFLLARRKLGNLPRRAADEEDVVLSAFNSFCQAAAVGRFPQLHDRHDLWRVLVMLTARKAVRQLRREHAQKRGGGAVRGESFFVAADSSGDFGGIDQVLGSTPTPQFATAVSEQCARLLDLLGDASLRAVALLKLEGYTNEEIAAKLNCVTTTVERKLARIRKKWQPEIDL